MANSASGVPVAASLTTSRSPGTCPKDPPSAEAARTTRSTSGGSAARSSSTVSTVPDFPACRTVPLGCRGWLKKTKSSSEATRPSARNSSAEQSSSGTPGPPVQDSAARTAAASTGTLAPFKSVGMAPSWRMGRPGDQTAAPAGGPARCCAHIRPSPRHGTMRGMRHFGFLAPDERDRLFLRPPQEFGPDADPERIGVGLGASLYCPATRPQLAQDIRRRAAAGVTSMVVCLEDSVADGELLAAERNAVSQLRELSASGGELPLVFLRVRRVDQIPMLVAGLGEHAGVLAGFVLPKFGEETGAAYLDAVVAAGDAVGRRLLAMPVLEAPDLAYIESRISSLHAARQLIDKYRGHVPAVRVGATDLSGAYGLRRGREFTVWDIRVVADVLSAVVNVFGRVVGAGYVVARPVGESFSAPERMFKPQL